MYFPEMGQKMAKYLKIWAKMYKIWKYFEKEADCAQLLNAINC